LIENFFDQRERIVVDPNADRFEWDAVLQGQGVERQSVCCRDE
jgi:hypothetical protein